MARTFVETLAQSTRLESQVRRTNDALARQIDLENRRATVLERSAQGMRAQIEAGQRAFQSAGGIASSLLRGDIAGALSSVAGAAGARPARGGGAGASVGMIA